MSDCVGLCRIVSDCVGLCRIVLDCLIRGIPPFSFFGVAQFKSSEIDIDRHTQKLKKGQWGGLKLIAPQLHKTTQFCVGMCRIVLGCVNRGQVDFDYPLPPFFEGVGLIKIPLFPSFSECRVSS